MVGCGGELRLANCDWQNLGEWCIRQGHVEKRTMVEEHANGDGKRRSADGSQIFADNE